MTRYYSFILILIGINTGVLYAQQGPKIRFINKDSVYDFGEISREEPAKYVFEFKNTGTDDLVITNISSIDSNLKLQWSHKPIKHGKKGLITVTWQPAPDAGPGAFKDEVFITSNATTEPCSCLHISGVMMPGHSAPVQKAGKSSGGHGRRGR